MVKVYAPNDQYSGLSAGVNFVNGVGETDNENVLDWFRKHGYQVEDPEPPAAEALPPVDPPEPPIAIADPEPGAKPAKKGK